MRNENIDSGKSFDWGRVSAGYAKYRDIYPGEFYERIVGLGLCVEGQRVLDVGTGTGVLPRHLCKYGAKFTGADVSAEQIAEAVKLSRGMDIGYVVSPAEDVDFPDGSFDVITASQCFMYMDERRMLERAHHLLADGGHFLILFTSWIVEEGSIQQQSERLILKYNPYWNAHSRVRPPADIPKSMGGLFEIAYNEAYDIGIDFTRESWHGRIVACRGIGASALPDGEIAAFEAEHRAYLETMPREFCIPHYVTMLDLKKI